MANQSTAEAKYFLVAICIMIYFDDKNLQNLFEKKR